MQNPESLPIRADCEKRSREARSARRSRAIQRFPRQRQPGKRHGSVVAVGKRVKFLKPGAIDMDGEDRAHARLSANLGRPEKEIAAENQFRAEPASIPVDGWPPVRERVEKVKVRKSRAVGVDGEQRARAERPAGHGRSIQNIAR